MKKKETAEKPDYYIENGYLVFTAAYHLRRGYCCGSGCRHCPYEPKHLKGNRKIADIYSAKTENG